MFLLIVNWTELWLVLLKQHMGRNTVNGLGMGGKMFTGMNSHSWEYSLIKWSNRFKGFWTGRWFDLDVYRCKSASQVSIDPAQSSPKIKSPPTNPLSPCVNVLSKLQVKQKCESVKKAESNYEVTHASKQLALWPQSDLLTNGRRPHYVRQSKTDLIFGFDKELTLAAVNF